MMNSVQQRLSQAKIGRCVCNQLGDSLGRDEIAITKRELMWIYVRVVNLQPVKAKKPPLLLAGIRVVPRKNSRV